MRTKSPLLSVNIIAAITNFSKDSLDKSLEGTLKYCGSYSYIICLPLNKDLRLLQRNKHNISTWVYSP